MPLDPANDDLLPTLRTGLLAGIAAVAGLYLTSLHSYLLFHSLVEFLSIVVACGVFIVFWNSRRFLASGYYLFLGVALLAVAALDLMHTLAYKGMGVFDGDDGNLATQLWIAARALEAVSLLAAPLALRRRLNAGLVLAGYAAVVALILATIFYWRVFPYCFREGVGLTTFKTTSEYVICALLVGAVALLHRHRAAFDRRVYRLLALAILTTVAAELAFTRYVSAYGPANFAGHFLKLAAFWLVYKAIIEVSLRKPYDLVFRDLRRSEERLRMAQQAGRIGTFEWDLIAKGPMMIAGMETVYGNPPEGLTGRYEAWRRRVHPEDIQRVEREVAEALSGQAEYNTEYRIFWPDGSVHWVGARGQVVRDSQGRALRLIGVNIDITERRLAQAALIQAKAAAEAANEAKSRFLANMSHELRTPMNAILGMMDVALPKAADPTVKDCLATARESADLLLTLLNDLLDSAKIESGRLELESTPFSLRRMLDQIGRALAVRAAEKGLAFSCRVADETPDGLVGDRTRLQQVLFNLAGNAIKFTERGEVAVRVETAGCKGNAENCKLKIENCQLQIDEEPRPKTQDLRPKPEDPATAGNLQSAICNLQFAISDTGIGIPPGSLDAIFQPFAQADASTTRRFGGTGLGLSISKSLVEMMGGRIWVESQPARGSTFFFTVRLPQADAAPPAAEPAAPPATLAAAADPLRILLVEDNPANQKVVRYVLADRGHAVDIADDGQAAMGLTARHCYDVILMDVQMPGMDGLEATAAIRRRDAGRRRVPIIAMTAHAMPSDRDRCLAAGMDGYLSKPVDAQEMLGLIETLARGRTLD